MKHLKKTLKIPKIDATTILTDNILRVILTYLSIFDICRSSRVCRRWREIVEKDPLMFEHVNLENTNKNVSLFSILKTFSRDKCIYSMKLPQTATQTDTSYMVMQLPLTIQDLTLNNINMEFSKIFTRTFPNLKSVTLNNQRNRIKPFDEIEVNSLLSLSSAEQLNLIAVPLQLINVFNKFNLKHLSILDSQELNNHSLYVISKSCQNLKSLIIGGSEQKYNFQITLNGFEINLEIEWLELHYLARVGDETMEILAERFPKLNHLKIVRNNYERCGKISDQGLRNIMKLPLTHLSIIYTRKLKDMAHNYISNMSQLVYLCLRDCPLQYDVEIWNRKCLLLQEIDLSGDSWVSQPVISSLAKHPNLKILWLGHFEHGDEDCDTKLQQYPPEGLFLEGLFKQESNFQKLHTLHLEHNCNLTYWLYSRLSKLRPQLFFK